MDSIPAIFQTIGLFAAVVLPMWNIPFIIRICRRKSSEDVSLYWALGVWTCLVLMAPSGFISKDVVWRTFNIVNLILFSLLVIVVLYYRKGERQKYEE